ncbi:MAG: EamA family transporter [Firmicutes bacterium]|nr:EamA family transporter [Bacillota bacterium]
MFIGLVFYAINDRIDATTRKHLDITTDTMLHQAYRFTFLITGIVFLSRSFVPLRLVGGIIIIFACMLLVYDKKKFHFNKYVWLKLLNTLIFTAALTIDMYNSPQFNLPFFVFISFSVPAVYLMIARQATPKTLYAEIKRPEWWVILICGIAQALAAFAFLRGLQFRDYFVEFTSFTALHVLLNVFFAYFILKERNNLPQKIIASVIIVGMIIMIAMV